jgi:hypothetical protein
VLGWLREICGLFFLVSRCYSREKFRLSILGNTAVNFLTEYGVLLARVSGSEIDSFGGDAA